MNHHELIDDLRDKVHAHRAEIERLTMELRRSQDYQREESRIANAWASRAKDAEERARVAEARVAELCKPASQPAVPYCDTVIDRIRRENDAAARSAAENATPMPDVQLAVAPPSGEYPTLRRIHIGDDVTHEDVVAAAQKPMRPLRLAIPVDG